MEFKCASCGKTWKAYKTDEEKSLPWRQCPDPQCRSYATMPLDKYNQIVEKVRRMNPIGVDLPRLDAFLNLLADEGLLGRSAYNRRKIIARIVEEAQKTQKTPIKKIAVQT